jgi:hypothetical protein
MGKNPNLYAIYRPIAVSGTLSKVLERILLSEMMFECKVGRCLFGFRIRMSCAFVRSLMRKIITKTHARFLPLFLCNVYIAAAFDLVAHSQLSLTLLDQGVNPYIVALLSLLYSSVRIYRMEVYLRP